MPNLHLVPECYAETEMVKIIQNITENDVLNHQFGISGVARILKARDIDGYLNIGFVDNDKSSVPKYFDEFEIIERTPILIFKKHPTTNDFLFVANPAIEKFLWVQLNEIGKQSIEYDLGNTFEDFCKQLKSIRIENHDGYKRMITDLKNANTSGILFIRNQIETLKIQNVQKS